MDTPSTKIKGANVVAGLPSHCLISGQDVRQINAIHRHNPMSVRNLKGVTYATGLMLRHESPATSAKYVFATRLQNSTQQVYRDQESG